MKFLNRGEYFFFLIWPALTIRYLMVKGVQKMQSEPYHSPLTKVFYLPRSQISTQWLMPSVQHIPCLGAGCQERRIYDTLRCSWTHSRDRYGKGRTENAWREHPSYSVRDLSNFKWSRFLWFFSPFLKWNVSYVTGVNATKFECLSATLYWQKLHLQGMKE